MSNKSTGFPVNSDPWTLNIRSSVILLMGIIGSPIMSPMIVKLIELRFMNSHIASIPDDVSFRYHYAKHLVPVSMISLITFVWAFVRLWREYPPPTLVASIFLNVCLLILLIIIVIFTIFLNNKEYEYLRVVGGITVEMSTKIVRAVIQVGSIWTWFAVICVQLLYIIHHQNERYQGVRTILTPNYNITPYVNFCVGLSLTITLLCYLVAMGHECVSVVDFIILSLADHALCAISRTVVFNKRIGGLYPKRLLTNSPYHLVTSIVILLYFRYFSEKWNGAHTILVVGIAINTIVSPVYDFLMKMDIFEVLSRRDSTFDSLVQDERTEAKGSKMTHDTPFSGIQLGTQNNHATKKLIENVAATNRNTKSGVPGGKVEGFFPADIIPKSTLDHPKGSRDGRSSLLTTPREKLKPLIPVNLKGGEIRRNPVHSIRDICQEDSSTSLRNINVPKRLEWSPPVKRNHSVYRDARPIEHKYYASGLDLYRMEWVSLSGILDVELTGTTGKGTTELYFASFCLLLFPTSCVACWCLQNLVFDYDAINSDLRDSTLTQDKSPFQSPFQVPVTVGIRDDFLFIYGIPTSMFNSKDVWYIVFLHVSLTISLLLRPFSVAFKAFDRSSSPTSWSIGNSLSFLVLFMVDVFYYQRNYKGYSNHLSGIFNTDSGTDVLSVFLLVLFGILVRHVYLNTLYYQHLSTKLVHLTTAFSRYSPSAMRMNQRIVLSELFNQTSVYDFHEVLTRTAVFGGNNIRGQIISSKWDIYELARPRPSARAAWKLCFLIVRNKLREIKNTQSVLISNQNSVRQGIELLVMSLIDTAMEKADYPRRLNLFHSKCKGIIISSLIRYKNSFKDGMGTQRTDAGNRNNIQMNILKNNHVVKFSNQTQESSSNHQRILILSSREKGAIVIRADDAIGKLDSIVIIKEHIFVLSSDHRIFFVNTRSKSESKCSLSLVKTVRDNRVTKIVGSDGMGLFFLEQNHDLVRTLGINYVNSIENEGRSAVYPMHVDQFRFPLFSIKDSIRIPSMQIKQVACGESHILLLSHTGQIFSKGSNSHGQLGLPPIESPNDRNLESRDFRYYPEVSSPCLIDFSFVPRILKRGKFERENFHHILSSSNNAKVDTKPNTPNGFIACGSNHSMCYLHGNLYLWGCNCWGQLGTGSNDDKYIPCTVHPDFVSTENTVTHISGGDAHTVIISSTGLVLGCGLNSSLGVDHSKGCSYHFRVLINISTIGSGSAAETDIRNSTVPLACGPQYTAVVGENGKLQTIGAVPNYIKNIDSDSRNFVVTALAVSRNYLCLIYSNSPDPY